MRGPAWEHRRGGCYWGGQAAGGRWGLQGARRLPVFAVFPLHGQVYPSPPTPSPPRFFVQVEECAKDYMGPSSIAPVQVRVTTRIPLA